MRIPRIQLRAAQALLAAAAVALVACAGASTQSRGLVPDRSLPKPPVVLIHQFSVDAQDVAVDTLGPEVVAGTGSSSERVAEGRKVASAFAEKLVAKLRERGIPAQRAGYDARAPLHALVVKGQFLEIDQGSLGERMVIGFGAGTQEIRVRGQVYQVTESGLRRVREGSGEAHGDKMPGMAVPVGVGAVAGNAARSAVISGGMNVASEITGSMDSQLDDLAEKFAERAVRFYRDQGWM